MAKSTKTATPFDLINSVSPESVRENMDKFMSLAGEMTELSRDGLSAATASAQASAKGAQEINTKALSFFQDAMATGMEASKSVSSAKSVQEAMELQATYAKSAFDTCMKQFGEMASLYAATFKEAAAPLNAHAGTMVEKMQLVK
ncbi:MAG: phasin family protein [Hyphomonadaceae bacterium]|nr:phasin family protein [Hyphomonadaceae bacterium]